MATDSPTDLLVADQAVTGLPSNVRLGGLGRRFVGWLLDWLPLPILAVAPGILIAGDGPTDVLIIVLGAVAALGVGWAWVSVWMLAHRLGTPGMRVMRLRAVRRLTGRRLGWGRALLRQLVFAGLALSVLGWLVTLIMMASSPRRQGLHDLAAGSVVVDERDRSEREPATLLPLDPQATSGALSAPDAPEDLAAVEDGAPPPEPSEADPTRAREVAVDGHRTRASEPGEAEEGAEESPNPVSLFARPLPPGSANTAIMTAIPAEPGGDAAPAAPTPASDEKVLTVSAPPDRSRFASRWAVDLGGGRIVPLRRVLLIGRNPQSALGEDADVVGVGVHAAAVSKTHLALGWDEDGPWVMDRGSTNGTAILDDDGTPQPCPPDERVRLREGQTVAYGGQHVRVHRA